ncbi:hypothetical protein [Mesorhizobium sp. WSM3879]|uniref:hypothetical protein n=1 Tax=Mesorhizobium sp. WSM3879 TaxID=2029406 RepID=UPI0015CA4FAB|nr:hypothetical protein [Mesorhizobium sp. WSM3879]
MDYCAAELGGAGFFRVLHAGLLGFSQSGPVFQPIGHSMAAGVSMMKNFFAK